MFALLFVGDDRALRRYGSYNADSFTTGRRTYLELGAARGQGRDSLAGFKYTEPGPAAGLSHRDDKLAGDRRSPNRERLHTDSERLSPCRHWHASLGDGGMALERLTLSPRLSH